MPKKSVHNHAAEEVEASGGKEETREQLLAKLAKLEQKEKTEKKIRRKKRDDDDEPVHWLGNFHFFILPVFMSIVYLGFHCNNLIKTQRPDWKGRSAFVTGATGATGRSIVAQLANKDWTVVAMTRQESNDKLSLFPDLSSSKLEQITIMHEPNPEEWSKQEPLPLPAKLDALFMCHGTSREYPEVQEDMDSSGQEGFAKWLKRIDVDMTTRIAKAAIDAKVSVVSRISAAGADVEADTEGFGIYFQHQGHADAVITDIINKKLIEKFSQPDTGRDPNDHSPIRDDSSSVLIYRPGNLDRGEDKRVNRPWEQEVIASGNHTMTVDMLADGMINQMESILMGSSITKPGQIRIYSFEDTWQLVSDMAKKKIFHHNIWSV